MSVLNREQMTIETNSEAQVLSGRSPFGPLMSA